jgi:cephalosporin-C deacetylase-like acetyl esterase
MNRRQFLAAPIFTRIVSAQPARGTMLWDYILRELTESDARRRETLRAIHARPQLDALAQHVRDTLVANIGPMPERTPLNARITGTLARPGYIIEKIIFESRPSYYVSANLYRPQSQTARAPAVIQSCGHYIEGKAAPDYQRVAIGLARKGIVALVFDPMGQGERLMYGGRPASATAEHVIAGKPTLLVGRTLAHYRIWDAMRALDYLESRPEVDPARLGMVGHSGGGMMTLLTAPIEPRLKAVMSCCAVTTFFHKTKALLIADPEQIVPGIYPAAIDHPELIAAVAPRAFLIGAVLKDFVPLEGTRRTFEEVKPLFALAGAPDRVNLVETPGEHLMNRELREACYGWMLRHLAGREPDTREPDIEVESEDALRCNLPRGRSVSDLILERARELAPTRTGTPRPLARTGREPGIELPAQTTGTGSTLLILIAPRRNPQLAASLARLNLTVMQLDLRGWGETAPDKEDMVAWRAIEMGRPLIEMRVQDLLAVVHEQPASRRIYVVGVEQAGIVALHTAALDRRIAGIATINSLASYQDMLENPRHPEPVSSIVPGALAHYDLPQLADRVHHIDLEGLHLL